MYDKKLNVFILLAEDHNLSKVSEKMFITRTGVLKQIDKLEEEVGFSLFNRSQKGFYLNEEGQIYYDYAKKIMEETNICLSRIAQISHQTHHIKIGSSFLNPAYELTSYWSQIKMLYPSFKLEIVLFDDDNKNINHIINNLNDSFDLFCGLFDTIEWEKNCQFLFLRNCHFCIAMSDTHPLAHRKRLYFKDLVNYELLLPSYGSSPSVTLFEDTLVKEYPHIKCAHTLANYDLSTFNDILDSNKLLVSFDCWKDIHPGLVTLPIEYNKTIPYGIVYSKHPSKEVENFIKVIKNMTHQK